MDKHTYINKTLELTDDTDTYAKIYIDSTNIVQKLNNNLINDWQKREIINTATANNLKCNNGLAPRLYGLPKTHKNNCPMRPVTSFIGSPIYNLTQFMSKILNKTIGEASTYTRDTWHYIETLKTVHIPDNYTLIYKHQI